MTLTLTGEKQDLSTPKIAYQRRSYRQRAMGKDSLHIEMNTVEELQRNVLGSDENTWKMSAEADWDFFGTF